jgi:hypothetical protein
MLHALATSKASLMQGRFLANLLPPNHWHHTALTDEVPAGWQEEA